MKFSSNRSLESLRDVLKTQNATGEETAYWVFNNLSENKWENMTILNNCFYDGELAKTYGHYHGTQVNETYFVSSGSGILLLQQPYQNNFNAIEKAYLINMSAGQSITISPEYGHSWSNEGSEPLVLMDDWRAGHKDSDYEQMKKNRGMCVYLLKTGEEVSIEKNPNYTFNSKPQFITLEEFKKLV